MAFIFLIIISPSKAQELKLALYIVWQLAYSGISQLGSNVHNVHHLYLLDCFLLTPNKQHSRTNMLTVVTLGTLDLS